MARQHSFTATVKISGINPYVEVPPGAVNKLGGGAKLPVMVKVGSVGAAKKKRASEKNQKTPGGPPSRKLARDAAQLEAIARLASGGWFRSTLLAYRSSPHRLYLDTWMRETAGVGVGDRVHVTLKLDSGSRDVPVPAALRVALEANPPAKAAWDLLAPSRRREILTYLNFLKTPAALERNVQKTIATLAAKKD